MKTEDVKEVLSKIVDSHDATFEVKVVKEFDNEKHNVMGKEFRDVRITPRKMHITGRVLHGLSEYCLSRGIDCHLIIEGENTPFFNFKDQCE